MPDQAVFAATLHSTGRRDGETRVTLRVPKSETAEVVKLVQWEDGVFEVIMRPVASR